MNPKEEFKNLINDIKSKDKTRIQRQIPNLLTLTRGIIAPFLIVLFLQYNNLLITFISIVIYALTDYLDGWYARKHKVTSEFGALLDTICDKIFTFSIVIPLIVVSDKYLIVVLVLEIIIAIINSYAKIKGKITGTKNIGKVKTVILYTLLSLCYLSIIINIDNYILKYAVLFTNIIQVLTIVEYYKFYNKQKNYKII